MQGLSLWDVATSGSPFAKTVLAILLGFSIFSWLVIFQKFSLFRKSSRAT